MKKLIALLFALAGIAALGAVTMTPVNIGTAPNAGNGDPARTAFGKINQNTSNIVNNLNSLVVDGLLAKQIMATNVVGLISSASFNSDFSTSATSNYFGFWQEITNAGLEEVLVDVACFRSNYQDGTAYPVTLSNRIGTNINSPAWTYDGLRYTLAGNSSTVFPFPGYTNFTLVVVGGGPTNLAINTQQQTLASYYLNAWPTYKYTRLHRYMDGFYLIWSDLGESMAQRTLYEPINKGVWGLITDGNQRTLAVSCDSTNLYSFVDGSSAGILSTNRALWPTSADFDRLSFGGIPGYTISGDVTVSAFAFFSRALTTNEVIAVTRAMRWFNPYHGEFCFVGDSRTEQRMAGMLSYRQDWPWKFMHMGTMAGIPYVNAAESGVFSWQYADLDYMTNHVYQWRPGGKIQKVIAPVLLGVNDLYYYTNGGAVFASVSNVCTTLKDWGFTVWLLTERSGWGDITNQTWLNTMIRTNTAIYDQLVPYDEYVSPTDLLTPLYFDQCHMTDAGTTKLATNIYNNFAWRIDANTYPMFGSAVTTNYAIPGGATLYITNGLIMKVQ